MPRLFAPVLLFTLLGCAAPPPPDAAAFVDRWNVFRFPCTLAGGDGDRGCATEALQAPEGAERLENGLVAWRPVALGQAELGSGGAAPTRLQVEARALRTVLLVMAHQDDDLGLAYHVRALAQDGVQVHGVWLAGAPADGAPETAPSCETRAGETRSAFASMGIPAEHLTFFCYPDRGIGPRLGEIVERVTAEVERLRPDWVFTPAFEGGHMDHDLAGFVASQAAARVDPALPVFECPLYNLAEGRLSLAPVPSSMPSVVVDNDEAFFRALVEHYPSQRQVFELLEYAVTETNARYIRFRPRPNWDALARPVEGPLLYEVLLQPPGDFEGAYAAHVRRYLAGAPSVPDGARPSEQRLLEAGLATQTLLR